MGVYRTTSKRDNKRKTVTKSVKIGSPGTKMKTVKYKKGKKAGTTKITKKYK